MANQTSENGVRATGDDWWVDARWLSLHAPIRHCRCDASLHEVDGEVVEAYGRHDEWGRVRIRPHVCDDEGAQ